MVATKRGPFLSTRVPPKAAETPMTAIRIIMVDDTSKSLHPWAFIRGILKTDQA